MGMVRAVGQAVPKFESGFGIIFETSNGWEGNATEQGPLAVGGEEREAGSGGGGDQAHLPEPPHRQVVDQRPEHPGAHREAVAVLELHRQNRELPAAEVHHAAVAGAQQHQEDLGTGGDRGHPQGTLALLQPDREAGGTQHVHEAHHPLHRQQQDQELGRARQTQGTARVRKHPAGRQPLLRAAQGRRQILRAQEDPQPQEHRRHHRAGHLQQEESGVPRRLPPRHPVICPTIHPSHPCILYVPPLPAQLLPLSVRSGRDRIGSAVGQKPFPINLKYILFE